jgi:hypothetical protein
MLSLGATMLGCTGFFPIFGPGVQSVDTSTLDTYNFETGLYGDSWETGAFVDKDEDGSFANEDCDDDDDERYPGADDIPEDGIDQDCDGEDAQWVRHGTSSGFADRNGDTAGSLLIAVPIELSEPFRVEHLGVQIRAANGANALSGVYRDTNGRPGSLVIDAGARIVQDGPNAYKLGESVGLPAGTYWMAIVFDTTVDVATVDHPTELCAQLLEGGEWTGLPSAWGDGGSCDPSQATPGLWLQGL